MTINRLFKYINKTHERLQRKVKRIYIFKGVPDVDVSVRSYKTTYGSQIQLDCKVTAHPQVMFIYWQKESNNLTTTLYKGSVGTEGIANNFPSLIFTRPVTSDSGIYTCFASNKAGIQKSLPTILTVEGGM